MSFQMKLWASLWMVSKIYTLISHGFSLFILLETILQNKVEKPTSQICLLITFVKSAFVILSTLVKSHIIHT